METKLLTINIKPSLSHLSVTVTQTTLHSTLRKLLLKNLMLLDRDLDIVLRYQVSDYLLEDMLGRKFSDKVAVRLVIKPPRQINEKETNHRITPLWLLEQSAVLSTLTGKSFKCR